MNAQTTFIQMLDRHVTDARIRISTGEEIFTVGRSGDNGDGDYAVTVTIHNRRFFSDVLRKGNLGMGESYMAGDFDITEGTLQDFLTILLRNRIDQRIRTDYSTMLKILGVQILNALSGKRINIKKHYDDVGDDLFEMMLDKSMSYTCGYAASPDDSLEQMQFNKLDRICHKLRLQPGDHLMDIGCGYGNLLIHAARHYGVTGVGITNSIQHCNRGNQNIAESELADKVRIEFGDFRKMAGRYNKIASVGMLEHLQPGDHNNYFRGIAQALEPRGLGIIHTVGCNAAKNIHDPFIQKYIFPGSAQARLSEIANGLERHGLPVHDVENISRHYAITIKHWLDRFNKTKDQLDNRRYDRTFKRMWEYYLCCGIAAAKASDSALWQVLFSNDYAYPMPLQRV